MSRITVAVIVLASALAGCVRPCKPGTLLVTLSLDTASSLADNLVVQLGTGKGTLTAGGAHTPGASHGTIEIDFAGANPYVKGATVDVTVLAEKGNLVVGEGRASGFVLADGCSSLSLSVAATNVSTVRDLGTPFTGSADMTGFGPPVTLSSNATNKMDILFMIDNSPSMDAMQTELKKKLAQFFVAFEQLATTGAYADLNIGVVTSDYGAGSTPNLAGGCDKSPGGQKGLLQVSAATGTPEQMAGCMGPVGASFIHYAFTPTGATANLPAGMTDTTSLVNAFTCMASVGSTGCGFEHQLESVYAALHNTFENAGFVRDDALLTVVFVTNEDDGSAPPTTDVFNPDPAKAVPPPMGYGAVDTYRQTHFGVACVQNGALALTPYGDSGGMLGGCVGAENDNAVMLGAEWDVSRYINFFTQPRTLGGIKDDPSNVVLVAIDPPETPVQILQVASGTGNGKGTFPNPAAYQPCPAPNVVDGKNCLVRLQHSCQNTIQPGFFGDPAVRLNTVVRAAAYNQVFSICGDDLTVTPDYSKSLAATGNLLRARMLANCISSKIADVNDPECSVLEKTHDSDGGVKTTALPRCDRGGPPCWSLVSRPSCASASPDSVAVDLTTSGPLPAGTSVTASCKAL